MNNNRQNATPQKQVVDAERRLSQHLARVGIHVYFTITNLMVTTMITADVCWVGQDPFCTHALITPTLCKLPDVKYLGMPLRSDAKLFTLISQFDQLPLS